MFLEAGDLAVWVDTGLNQPGDVLQRFEDGEFRDHIPKGEVRTQVSAHRQAAHCHTKAAREGRIHHSSVNGAIPGGTCNGLQGAWGLLGMTIAGVLLNDHNLTGGGGGGKEV
jgi:hypothetical protein